jgi:GNAT superfamily N-acetyltransferase
MPEPRKAPDQVEITLAEPADARTLTEIQIRAFHDDVRRFDGARADDTPSGPPGYDSADWQLEMMKRGRYYAIRQAGRIVGGAIVLPLAGGVYNLGRIWVDPASQGRGIGRAAIHSPHCAFPDARSWTLETPAWAVRNHHLYESLGYVKVGERPCPDGFTEFLYERPRTSPAHPEGSE